MYELSFEAMDLLSLWGYQFEWIAWVQVYHKFKYSTISKLSIGLYADFGKITKFSSIHKNSDE